jgi:hypothetical protein
VAKLYKKERRSPTIRTCRAAAKEEIEKYSLSTSQATPHIPSSTGYVDSLVQKYPSWMHHAVKMAQRYHEMEENSIEEESKKRRKSLLHRGSELDDFATITQHPFLQGGRFGPDVPGLSTPLPSSFPVNAGMARQALRRELAGYFSIRRRMQSVEKANSVTLKAVQGDDVMKSLRAYWLQSSLPSNILNR